MLLVGLDAVVREVKHGALVLSNNDIRCWGITKAAAGRGRSTTARAHADAFIIVINFLDSFCYVF